MNTSSSGSPSSSQDRSDTYQRRVDEWVIACFGDAIRGDKVERNHRFLEESLELVQACGCVASEAHQLVDYVFGRAVGEPGQEVGGVMNTLAALCNINDLDMMAEGDVELTRCWAKIEKIRAKQAAKPKHSPLPGPSESSPGVGAKSDQGKDTRDEQTASLLSRLKEAERELANLREWRWSFDPLTLTHAMVVGLLAEVNDNDAGRDLAETLEAVRDNLTVAARDLQAAEARIKVLEEALERLTGAVERMREADDLPSPPATAEMLRSAWRSVGEAATAARSALPQLGGENG